MVGCCKYRRCLGPRVLFRLLLRHSGKLRLQVQERREIKRWPDSWDLRNVHGCCRCHDGDGGGDRSSDGRIVGNRTWRRSSACCCRWYARPMYGDRGQRQGLKRHGGRQHRWGDSSFGSWCFFYCRLLRRRIFYCRLLLFLRWRRRRRFFFGSCRRTRTIFVVGAHRNDLPALGSCCRSLRTFYVLVLFIAAAAAAAARQDLHLCHFFSVDEAWQMLPWRN